MMSLWDMLLMISGGTALGGAVAGAKLAGGGVARTGVGVVLGLILGFLSVAAVRRVGERVLRNLPPDDGSMKTPARLPLTYLGAVVWALGPSLFLSMMITRSILRFVLP